MSDRVSLYILAQKLKKSTEICKKGSETKTMDQTQAHTVKLKG